MRIFIKSNIENLDTDKRKEVFHLMKTFLYNAHSLFNHSVLGNQFGDYCSYPIITNSEIMFSGKENDSDFFYFDKHGKISEKIEFNNYYSQIIAIALCLHISDIFENDNNIFLFKIDLEGIIISDKKIFINKNVIAGLGLYLYVAESDPFFDNKQSIIEIFNFLNIIYGNKVIEKYHNEIIRYIKENKLDKLLMDYIYDYDNL